MVLWLNLDPTSPVLSLVFCATTDCETETDRTVSQLLSPTFVLLSHSVSLTSLEIKSKSSFLETKTDLKYENPGSHCIYLIT